MKILIFLSFVLFYQSVISQITYNTSSEYYPTTKKSIELLTSINCDSLSMKLVDEINLYRTQNCLGVLMFDKDAFDYAKSHIDFLTKTKTFKHSDISKSNFILENLNMINNNGSDLNFDENWIQSVPTLFLNSWKKSPGHNSNLLNKYVTKVGISITSIVYTQNGKYFHEMRVVMVAN